MAAVKRCVLARTLATLWADVDAKKMELQCVYRRLDTAAPSSWHSRHPRAFRLEPVRELVAPAPCLGELRPEPFCLATAHFSAPAELLHTMHSKACLDL